MATNEASTMCVENVFGRAAFICVAPAVHQDPCHSPHCVKLGPHRVRADAVLLSDRSITRSRVLHSVPSFGPSACAYYGFG